MSTTDINSLSERIEIIHRKRIEDSRGWFLKAITGFENGLPKYTGEVYVVYSENGASRGGHYHKQAAEWFTVLLGRTVLKLHDVNSSEQLSMVLNSSEPITVVIPPFVAHRFDSIGNDSFMVLAYSDLLFEPADSIAFNL